MCTIMLTSFILTLAAFPFMCSFALPTEGLYKLDIIHYNDFHARYEETSLNTPTCRTNNGSCLGGYARLYYMIQLLKREKPDSLLLNAGDIYQGTYWYSLLKWSVSKEYMNLLPHDALAIGNHEFDDGPEGLLPLLEAVQAPFVAANMDTSNDTRFKGLYKPYVIVERNERKIGIIGLITPDTATLSTTGNVTFSDPRKAAKREAKALNEKGVDIIIILSHCGLEMDKEIARDYGQHVDVIVGGHSHSLLWNGPAPSGETVAGPYPVLIETNVDKEGGTNKHQVVIVQASAFTKYIGNLSVYFDTRGEYVKWEGGPLYLDRSVPEDPEIKARLETYAELVRDAQNITFGVSETTLNYEDCVYGECALGNLLTDSLMELSDYKIQSSLDVIVFIQRGDIKSSIMKGTILKGDAFEVLPYNDRIVTYLLQGKYVLEALEHSVSNAWDYNPFKGPNVLQVSGLRVTYNITLPEGQRVTSVLVGEKNTPLDPEKDYQMITPHFLANGADGFTMFKEGRNFTVVGRDLQVFEYYVRQHTPLNVKTEGRIVINQ